jgi:hypothetical protein
MFSAEEKPIPIYLQFAKYLGKVLQQRTQYNSLCKKDENVEVSPVRCAMVIFERLYRSRRVSST